MGAWRDRHRRALCMHRRISSVVRAGTHCIGMGCADRHHRRHVGASAILSKMIPSTRAARSLRAGRRVAACLLLIASTAFAAEETFLSKVYTIDKKYRSMEGPSSVQTVYLGDRSKPELLWITGIRTEMVTEDGTTPQLPELMCHVNVDLDANKHQALFDLPRPVASRLMTLSQGMLDSKLPPGFGFPIASDEPLLLFTQ